MGVANCFAARHQEHSRVWGTFDLPGSALLRARSRGEVLRLESALRHQYGDCSAADRAQTKGQVLTSEDLIAMGSWRRHPGRCDKGCTEFYTVECFEAMVASAREWLATRGRRAADARLQRGISLSECSTQAQRVDPRLTRGECRELRARRRAAAREFAGKVRLESNELMARVIYFATAHEEYLLGVDLRSWRKARATRDATQDRYGLVCLYFHSLEDRLHQDDARLGPWLEAQGNLQEDFAPLAALKASTKPNDLGRRCLFSKSWEGVSTLLSGVPYACQFMPRPIPLQMLRVCVGNCHSDIFHPLFETFEELARRLERSRSWDQAEFRW